MKTVGIICECNPLHGGHQYLLTQARASGADVVVALMSGWFVERGEPAVADPFLRAEALLRCGADLVLELPYPYAAAGAEFFADAGVDILARLGPDELWFGSECGDLPLLSRMSRITLSKDFEERYSASVGENGGSAESYFSILQEMAGEDTPILPNDILGISYLRSICRRDAHLRPVTVRRVGSGYAQTDLTTDTFPSASALRRLWREKGLCEVLPLLPPECREVYAKAGEPADVEYAARLILGHFRLTSADTLSHVAELGGGLGNRMAEAARNAESLQDFFALAATKKYTDARIRRGVLFALTGVEPEDLRSRPAYTRLLAANACGSRFLATLRGKDTIPVITRHSDLTPTLQNARQTCLSEQAYRLYTLCLRDPASATTLWKRSPIFLP